MRSALVAKKRTGRPKSPDAVLRVSAFGVRSTPEWRDWVIKLADFDRINLSDLVDRALIRYAKEVGFPDPPPKR